ncbi:MAG: beta-xylosidase, partial [Flavisolibacter sp.]|nr:beta-xylosidase [Flavisolibacter sp.]
NAAYIMVWNYYDDDTPAPAASVQLQVTNVPAKKVRIEEYRIDEQHSNAYTLWKKMGSPQQVTDAQYKELEKAGKLQLFSKPYKGQIREGVYTATVRLPRQAVSLIKISW